MRWFSLFLIYFSKNVEQLERLKAVEPLEVWPAQ